jgi:propanediol dehydratase small subunit
MREVKSLCLQTGAKPIVALAVAASLCTSTAGAQDRRVIRVHVADSVGAPVEYATVTARRLGGAVIAAVKTDSLGNSLLGGTPDRGARITVTRLGFSPSSDSVVAGGGQDTVAMNIMLTRIAEVLAPVETRASRRILSDNYELGAKEIAQSHRTILDAYDALRDLRPNMLGDLSRGCGLIANLWINGRHIFDSPWGVGWMPRSPFASTSAKQSHSSSGSGWFPAHATANSPLARIRPEYIASMRYVSCWNKAPDQRFGRDALYITLKPGVGYDYARGTYVADSASARDAGVIR